MSQAPTMLRHLLTWLLLQAVVLAASPEWRSRVSNSPPGNHPALPPGTLEYSISWKGIMESGRLQMEFSPPGRLKADAMVVRSSATSMGLASSVFPYQGDSWSELEPNSLHPRYFHSTERTSKEKVTTTNRFRPDHVDSLEITESNRTKPTETREYRFDQVPTYDIPSALLWVRSQSLKANDEYQLVIHPFTSPYLLTAKVIGREQHMDRDAIRISIGMRKIDRASLDLKAYKKLKREATLWLSDDAQRIPLEVRADLFIGDIRATLKDFRKS